MKAKNNPKTWVEPKNAPKAQAWMQEVVADSEWTVTTKKAESFLQYLMDCVIKQMRENEIELAKKEQREPEEIPDVNVQLVSTRLGKHFIPFFCVLDASCLKSRGGRRRRSSEELEIFNPEIQSRGARLKDPIYKYVVSPFTYTRNDEKGFFLKAGRQALGMNIEQARALKQYREPRIQRLGKNHDEYVTVIMDPLRLFYMMADQTRQVTGKGKSGDRFDIQIKKNSIERIQGSNWKYTIVTRTIKPGKNKNRRIEEDISKELERNIMNGR